MISTASGNNHSNTNTHGANHEVNDPSSSSTPGQSRLGSQQQQQHHNSDTAVREVSNINILNNSQIHKFQQIQMDKPIVVDN